MDKKDGSVGVMIGDGKSNVNDLPDILKTENKPPLKKISENGVLIL